MLDPERLLHVEVAPLTQTAVELLSKLPTGMPSAVGKFGTDEIPSFGECR